MKAYNEELTGSGRQLPQTRSVKVDESLARLAWLMDDLIRVPGLGWRFAPWWSGASRPGRRASGPFHPCGTQSTGRSPLSAY